MMFQLFTVTFVLILVNHCDTAIESSDSDNIASIKDRIQKGKDLHKKAVGTLIDHIFDSIEQRKEKEAAEREKLKELAAELQPYIDRTKAKIEGEKELSDLDKALAEAQLQMSQDSSLNTDEKQQEIAKIRDQINSIRYGLKERLRNILGGVKKPKTEAIKKSGFLNEITGVSSWQTATWLLLALCIILSVALIAILTRQMYTKNNYYERLGNMK